MTVDTFESDLLDAFPELGPKVSELNAWWDGERPGIHILVGDVLTKHLLTLLRDRDVAGLQRVFALTEEMARSEDKELENALAVSLLERLGDSRADLEYAREFMGPDTLALSHATEKSWGRE